MGAIDAIGQSALLRPRGGRIARILGESPRTTFGPPPSCSPSSAWAKPPAVRRVHLHVVDPGAVIARPPEAEAVGIRIGAVGFRACEPPATGAGVFSLTEEGHQRRAVGVRAPRGSLGAHPRSLPRGEGFWGASVGPELCCRTVPSALSWRERPNSGLTERFRVPLGTPGRFGN